MHSDCFLSGLDLSVIPMGITDHNNVDHICTPTTRWLCEVKSFHLYRLLSFSKYSRIIKYLILTLNIQSLQQDVSLIFPVQTPLSVNM